MVPFIAFFTNSVMNNSKILKLVADISAVLQTYLFIEIFPLMHVLYCFDRS